MRALLIAFLVTVLAAGCSTVRNIQQTDHAVTDNHAAANAALNALRTGEPTVTQDGVTVIEDRLYVPSAPVQLDQDQTLPTSCNITFAPANEVTLLEFGQTVSKVCGLQVRVTPDALNATRPGGYSDDAQMPSSAAAAIPIPMPPGVSLPSPLGGPGMGYSASSMSPNRIGIRYSGELSGLLDAVTARLGLSWRYRGGVVTVFYLDTQFFRLFSIPTSTQMASVVTSGTTTTAGAEGGGGSGGGAGGIGGSSSSSQSTSVMLETNAGGDISTTVSTMLTPNVGRMSYSQSSGTLTVTDTPEALRRIGDYVSQFNDFATKQVLLNVKVLSVQINDSDEFGINWTAIYESLADQYGIGLVSAFDASEGAVSGSVSILEGSSRFSGSQLVINALSQQGRVSVLTQPSVTTLNLEPVPVQVAKQTSYLAESTTTLTSDVGATTSLSPGTVTTGFNMNLLPYILPDNKTVLLQYSVNLSELNNLRRVESGGSAIEIPEVDNRILSQKVRLRSGETLVLSGFEQTTEGNDRSGVGSPLMWLLGGGVKAKSARQVLVVMITPIVMA